MANFLSLDLGSSKIKALICRESGEIIKSAEKEIMPSYKSQKVEYDPKEFLKSCFEVLGLVLNDFPEEIDAFCVASQRSSFLFCDSKGEPLTPILSWQDGRASELLEKINISQEETNEITGLYKTPYYSASKASLLLKEIASLSSQKILFMPLPSFLIFHLSFGKYFICDCAIAQRTLLFDAGKGIWSGRLCDIFGISENILPKIVPTFLKEPLMLNFNSKKLPLRAMTGDQQAAALPFLDEKTALVNFGTGAFILGFCGEKFIKIPGILTSVSSAEEKNISYMLEGTVNSCGTFLKWLELKMGIKPHKTSVYGEKTSEIFVIPAIGGIGSPYWDYDTKTSFYGFDAQSGSQDLVNAALEGIIFLLNESIEVMRKKINFSQIAVTGGLSDLDYLPSFLSDITRLNVFRPKAKEATSLGLSYFTAAKMGFDCRGWEMFNKEKEFSPLFEDSIIEKKKIKWKNFFSSVRNLNHKK
ncbi:MAG: hypothetical protein GX447_00290 [Elusimicrobia bacterium]|nr:hypothetical protein [Elusimicrobiota bacterium]